MRKMLFDSPQPKVTIVPLRSGKYDVTVLDNEEVVTMDPPYFGYEEEEEPLKPQISYRYDGNIFRTIYPLTEEEILSDMEKWLNYNSSGEPTIAQIRHDDEIADRVVSELFERGVL